MLRYACALLEEGSAWQGRAVCSPSGTCYRIYVFPLRLICVCVRMYSRAVCSPSGTPICVFSHTTASCSTRYYMLQLCCSSVAAVASQARLYACSRMLLRPVVLYTIYMSSYDYIHASCSNMLALRHAYTICCSSVAALLQLCCSCCISGMHVRVFSHTTPSCATKYYYVYVLILLYTTYMS